MDLHDKIMKLLRQKMQEPYEYVNPHFLLGIADLLEAYYGCEDDDVDKWIQDMFSA
jgi:hypothetical protein